MLLCLFLCAAPLMCHWLLTNTDIHFQPAVTNICCCCCCCCCCCRSYDVPLVADIHFQPAVAMMVAEAFEKVRSPSIVLQQQLQQQQEWGSASAATSVLSCCYLNAFSGCQHVAVVMGSLP
jgi:hypothetical protein